MIGKARPSVLDDCLADSFRHVAKNFSGVQGGFGLRFVSAGYGPHERIGIRDSVLVGTGWRFWGKTPRGEKQAWPYKPVVHHLIDVTAVALRLQERHQARLRREAAVFGASAPALMRTTAYLVGLHDLGKFSSAFQAKVPELWPADLLGPYRELFDPGHWRNTAVMLNEGRLKAELRSLFPELGNGIGELIASIAGHHGRPPHPNEYDCDWRTLSKEARPPEATLLAALEAMRILRRLIEPEPIPALRELEQCQAWSWRLAGFATFSDWIGSDAEIFRFEDPAMAIEDYWALALERADRAIELKGLAPIRPASRCGLAELAPSIHEPRPMQLEAETLPLAAGPELVIIEDGTGSGKTEAALVLAARMIAAGKAEGLYFALPTMATANAMYARVGDLHLRLFEAGAQPSLVLAHGQAKVTSAFLDSIASTMNGSDAEEEVAAFCSEWIADDRRRAFFANVGVGTIDQAFLAVLRKRHLALRQYGLAGRILLVDEAHSFDAYMSRELETLLSVHAAAGGSAIVLSATLPRAKREALVAAFRSGLTLVGDGVATPARTPLENAQCYPLLTRASWEEVTERPVRFAEGLRRDVRVERVADAATAHEAALGAARRGAAVLLLRNAVDEAIASYQAISAKHPRTRLFHARFAMCDRQRIEADVLARFGRESKTEARRGQILVATQVVEQSLDLDFDLVITDLAPVDLVIQRAGRLWRHMDRRPAPTRPVSGPTIFIISPAPETAGGPDWLDPVLGRGAAVYRHPGVMWRSARVLFEAGAIRTPDGLRDLIEQVYGSDDVPAGFGVGQDKAQGDEYGRRSLADSNLIDFAEGYAVLGDLSTDEDVGTRDGEPTVTLRLARLEGEQIVPWARGVVFPDNSPISRDREWAMSEVRVRKGWVGDVMEPAVLAPQIRTARADWPEWDHTPILTVQPDGIAFSAAGGRALTYDAIVGLRHAVPPQRE